jgi:DNA-binding MarR family transcriptional regulator
MDVEQIAFEALRRIMRATDIYSRWLLREHRLTAPQLAILTELSRHREAPVGVLAKAAFIGAPTVTGIVDRLEKHGLVVRVRSASDRRQVFVALTEDGQKLLDSGPAPLSAQFDAQMKELPESERQSMCHALQKVAEMLEAATPSDVANDATSLPPV